MPFSLTEHRDAKLHNQDLEDLGLVQSQWDPQGEPSFTFLIFSSFEISQLKSVLFSTQGKPAPKKSPQPKKQTMENPNPQLLLQLLTAFRHWVESIYRTIQLEDLKKGEKMKKELAVLFTSWIHYTPAGKHRHKGQMNKTPQIN